MCDRCNDDYFGKFRFCQEIDNEGNYYIDYDFYGENCSVSKMLFDALIVSMFSTEEKYEYKPSRKIKITYHVAKFKGILSFLNKFFRGDDTFTIILDVNELTHTINKAYCSKDFFDRDIDRTPIYNKEDIIEFSQYVMHVINENLLGRDEIKKAMREREHNAIH